MERQKMLHGNKTFDHNPSFIITGSGRQGSIGEAIGRHLYNRGWSGTYNHEDVLQHSSFPFHSNAQSLIMCHGVTELNWLEDAIDMREIIDINLTSMITILQKFVQERISSSFRKQVVIIGSMAYNHVLNGSAAYCASKAGLNHFVRCAAWELAPKGFDIYIINPSNVEGTPMTEDTIQGLMSYRGLTRKEAEAYWGACLPRADWLQKEDIAELVHFLLSGKGQYLAGNPIDLAGGQR